jgi:hypothetical protein
MREANQRQPHNVGHIVIGEVAPLPCPSHHKAIAAN